MPRAPRLYAPEATVHVVARSTNREVSFSAPEDFAMVLGKLWGLGQDDGLTLSADTVMCNRVHRLLQAPRGGTLAA